MIYQKILGKGSDKMSLLFVQTSGGAIAGFGGVALLGQSFLPSLDMFGLLVLVAFGFFFLLISYLFLVGFKYANLNTGSVIVSTELLFAPLMAFALLSEELDTYILAGGALMVLAVVFVYLSDNKET